MSEPLKMPEGMTREDLDSVSVFDERWRLLDEFVCARCGDSAYAHPFTNLIWGCKWCGYRTYSVAVYFKEAPKSDSIKWVVKRVKPLSELTGVDIPPGLDPEDVATDCSPCGDAIL